ncbi:amino acid adenylation domain-containing protein, partial [Pseudomonas entomophila]|uniref:non-ribosomal peptide synthetase/type I polyketide synthase n=1 Tax=Pseudomonas entomophila TaxID=312306 RepID=UPI0023D80AE1
MHSDLHHLADSFSSNNNLIDLLEARARLQPDNEVYTFLPAGEGSPDSLTYAKLHERARKIACYLHEQDVSADARIMLLFHAGIDYICAFFGCLYAGAIPVPAYPPTHARQFDRLKAVIKDADTNLILTGRGELEGIRSIGAETMHPPIGTWLVLDEANGDGEAWINPAVAPERIAFLQYTSGSTGTPKGVMVTHGNALANIRLTALFTRSGPQDVMVFWLPPYHDFGLIGGILAPLVLGCSCVLMRPSSFLLSPLRWLKAISDYRGTITGAPNFAYDLCARSVTEAQRASLDLSCLRVAFNGAEPIRHSTLDRFTDAFSDTGFRPQAWLAAYGLAESTLMVSGRWGETMADLPVSLPFMQSALREKQHAILLDEHHETLDVAQLVNVGRILSDHQVAIVDPHTRRRVEDGRIGEIWINGPCVAKGYWQREADSEAAFAAKIDGDPGSVDALAYMRTGDLGFIHEGCLYIGGRHKDLIIINGLNIYPQDVERAAFESHPSLRQDGAIAFALETDGTEKLVVVQELDFRRRADDAMVGGIAAAISSSIGMPPDVIGLVSAGRLPRTSSGKVRRSQCRQDFLDGKLELVRCWHRPEEGSPALPVPVEQASVTNTARPVSLAEVEAWLRGRLAERIGVAPETLDADQPFEFYGLNSMAAVQLTESLASWLGRPVEPIVFWDHPTLARLSRFLSEPDSAKLQAQANRPSANEAAEAQADEIAIIGLSCRLPGADDPDAFWRLLEANRDAVTGIHAGRVAAGTFEDANEDDGVQVRRGGFLDSVDRFDARFFSISPREAVHMDPQQRLAMELAWEALEDAGIVPASLAGSDTGVFVGISTHDYEAVQHLAAEGPDIYSATGNASSIVANRLSYFLDLRGPSLAIDTACSSSLVAVHAACQSLRQGETGIALAGGVNLILSTTSSLTFARAGMLSPDGRCKAFDAGANGYVRGEGGGLVVLKRLRDAVRDGDAIRAVIRGSAVMQDGRGNGLVAPNGSAQSATVAQALARARLEAKDIAYLEAHGTGTVLGDPIELNALKSVFAHAPEAGTCLVGSVKTNIGHLEAAAGVASLIKVVLALEHDVIPASLHYREANPHCRLDDTPLRIVDRNQAWDRPPHQRHAGISSFGFGGTLAHMIVSAAPETTARADTAWPVHLLMSSARSEAALEAAAAGLAGRVAAWSGEAMADAAYTTQVGRTAFEWRRVELLVDAENAAGAASARGDSRVMISGQARAARMASAFMFPGQGAQKIGMARELYSKVESFRATVTYCAARLREHASFDLLELLYGEDTPQAQAALDQTEVAQPALFVIEFALAQLWMSWGVQPVALVGHSIGEYVAACLAGVFSLDDALALVAARGRLMQRLPGGAMLSVALDEASLREHLDGSLSLAAVNAAQRCVVAGDVEAIAALESRLGGRAIVCRRVSTSHAFHSHMMEPVLAEFTACVARVARHAPTIPFVSNVTGTWIEDAQATDPAYWATHLRATVRFTDCLERIGEASPVLIEVGPGQTLCGLARQAGRAASDVLPTLRHHDGHASDLATLLSSAGKLWVRGQPIDWHAMHAGQARRIVHLPTYPFERERHWIDRPTGGAPGRTAAMSSVVTTATHRVPSMPTSAQRKNAILLDLRGMVAKMLHADADRVDPHTPLLELGADSLMMVQAISSIEQTYGVTISVRQLFEELTTVAAIADYLDEKAPLREPLVRAEAGGNPEPALPVIALSAPVPAALPVPPAYVAESPAAVAQAVDKTMLERLFSQQIDTFSRLTSQQFALLQGVAADASVQASVPAHALAGAVDASAPVPAPSAPQADTGSKPYVPFQPAHITLANDPFRHLGERQRAYLDRFLADYALRTRGSKALAQHYRPVLADNRVAAGFRLSTKEVLYPVVSVRSEGAYLWDVDDNAYIDLAMGFGVNLFGHRPDFVQDAIRTQLDTGLELGPQTRLSGEVAEMVTQLTGMERVAFCNSGTEAVMLALRLARTVTRRDKIVVFAGSYHGWSDDTLMVAGEHGTMPIAPGLQPGAPSNTLVLDFGSTESLEQLRKHAHEIAAVLVEPVQSRRPHWQPREFLHALRALTQEHGIALIFDEMIMGFRLHPGGAQGWYGIRADLATYGKVVGGGLPAGIVAGSAAYMDAIDGGQWQYGDASSPQVGTTFYAGTFCKHPLTLVAARAVLQRLIEAGPALQENLNARTADLVQRLNAVFASAHVPIRAVHCGSSFRLLEASPNIDLLYYHLIAGGLYLWEGRGMFLSTAHSDADVDRVVEIFERSVAAMVDAGFFTEEGFEPPPSGGAAKDRSGVGVFPARTALPVAASAAASARASIVTNFSQTFARRPISFGLSFFGSYDADYRDDKYRLLFEAARFADTHAFSSVWVPERHFHSFGGLSPNPSVLSAALARETSRIELRAGSVVLPLHHPIRVAEEWSMVDNLSSGRAGIACASGWHPNDFVFAPEAFGDHRELMFQRIEEVRALWRGEALRVKDGSQNDTEVRLFPMPSRAELPIWITIVGNPDMYRRAGAIGAGVLTNLMGQSIDELEANLRVYRDALAEHGHGPEQSRVTVLLHSFVTDDAEQARECARGPFIAYLKSSLSLFQNMVNSLGMQADIRTLSEADREFLLSAAYDRYVATQALIGDVASCAPIVERLQALGVDEIGCFVDFGIEHSLVLKHLEQLNALRQACEPKPLPDILPLTPSQSGIWFECQLGDEAALSYNATTVLGLRGPLDTRAMKQALQSIVERHSALRTVVDAEGRHQRVLPELELALTLVDWRDTDDADAAAAQWFAEHSRRRMDLATGPLMQAHLLRMREDDHRLVLTFHHFVIDGYSQELLLNELAACYNAACRGAPAALPLAYQFGEYIAESERYRQGDRYREDQAYWQSQLAGLPSSAPLLDELRARDARPGYRAGRRFLTVDGERYARLQRFSREQGCTLFMTLLAGVSVLLQRLANQQRIVVGVPMTVGRPERADANLIGCTLNLVPMLCDGVGDPSVAEFLMRVRRVVLDAHQHGQYPFSQIIRDLGLHTDQGRPLAPVLFNLNRSLSPPEFQGLDGSLEETPASFSADALTIDATQLPDRLHILFQYQAPLLGDTIVEQMMAQFTSLLDGMMADPACLISRLPMLAEADRQRMLVDWNEVETAAPAATLPALFEAQVARAPDAVALTFEGQALDYARLNERANQLAHGLLALGVEPDQRVAICAARGPAMLVAILGVLKAGAAYVPLDPDYPAERLAYVLADSAPVAIVAQAATRATVEGLGDTPVIDLDDAAALAAMPTHNPAPGTLAPHHLAYVIYTSGSTGQPKGVMVEHRQVARLFSSTQAWFGFGGTDVWTLFHSYAFDFSVWEIFGALLHGGRLVIVPHGVTRSPEAFHALLCREGVTVLNQTPSAFRQLAAVQALEAAREHSLRLVIFGGEALEVSQLQPWCRRAENAATQLVNMYGITETTVHVTYHPIDAADVAAGGSPIGQRIPDLRLYLLDAHGEPVAVGVSAELYVGGAGVARGYLNLPELTRERFLADPFSDEVGARMYRTGDLGRWRADGTLEYLGRNDDQVKLRGFRIELGEIGARLSQCEGVVDAAVIVREDAPGDKRLVAYYTSDAADAAAGGVDAQQLRRQMQSVLPEHMVPSAYVCMQRLPLTLNGKLDRRALPAPQAQAYAAQAYEAPLGETETAVSQIWQELLGVERVGRHDDFFALGGHSLLAVQVVSRLRQTMDVELGLAELFTHGVLADFAARVAQAGSTRMQAIATVDRGAPLRLSWAQQRLWLLDQVDASAGAAYHMPMGLRLSGRLDRQALRATLDRIVARHEVLRTTFMLADGDPVQCIAAADQGFSLIEHDLGELDESAQQRETDRLSAQVFGERFDLAQGPLIRGQLLRLSPTENLLLINQHHIISDGWSISVLVQEVNTLYTAFSQGLPDPLPALALQYADYAAWQREWLQGEVLQTQTRYWTQHLAGAPELLDLPLDRPRPRVQSYAGASVAFRLSPGLSGGLKQLAQRHGATLFMTLFAGWGLLMSRLSGQADVVVGTPVANRQRREIEGLIGFFVNTLAVRVSVDGNLTVAELLAQVKASTLGAYEHQDVPFEQVVEALKPQRSQSYSPLFQSALTYGLAASTRELHLPELRLSSIPYDSTVTKADLHLMLDEDEAGIGGELIFSSALFDVGTIERMVDGFQVLLSAMVADEQAHVGRLALLSADHRRAVLAFGEGAAGTSRHPLVLDLFDEQVRARPDAPALEFGDAELSYAELNRRANQVARRLLALGVRPDDRVAISVERGIEMVVGLLGIMRAGAAYVPLDPTYPEERLAYMLSDSKPVALLTQLSVEDSLPASSLLSVIVLDDDAALARQSTDDLEAGRVELSPDHLAYVIYTSGSTGRPKGVMNRHGGLCNLAQAQIEQFEVGPDSRVLQFASFSFDASVSEIVMALGSGATLVLVQREAMLPGEALEATLRERAISHVTLPSLAVAAMPEGAHFPSLRLVIAGDACPPALAARWAAQGTVVFNAYGPTEAAVCATIHRCGPELLPTLPLGRAIANVRIRIVDEQGGLVPIGVAGEICIGGAGVARGYMNQPELTAERFVDDPFGDEPGARLYKTGDIGRWREDGLLEYLGRRDFQVKLRGFRIELGEIETQLVQIDGVAEAAVLARQDHGGSQRLVAYLCWEDGAAVEPAELRGRLAESLPDYMVPAAFVTLARFPLTPNGKLDRKALPEPDDAALVTQPYAAPQGRVETVLASIWQALLQAERVGRDDDFFALGGDSMHAVKLMVLVRQQLGTELAMAELFANPTLAGVAATIEAAGPSSLPAITAGEREAVMPLSFAQQRLWFLAQMEGGSAAYHVPGGVRLLGTLDHAVLHRALDMIVARHEVLRTVFTVEEGRAAQRIEPAQTGFALRFVDLENSPNREAALAERVERDAAEPFDLRQGPLIRGNLLRLAADEHVLLLTLHHIVSDGWSLGVLIRELAALYRACLRGEADPLPALPIQYADYAAWQRRWLEGEVLQRQADYWQKQLAGAPSLLSLPTDRPRPARQDYAGASIELVFDADLVAGLRKLGLRHDTTPFMTVLAAWAAVLGRLAGQDEVVIGVPVANRMRPEVEGLIGFFVNTLALRVNVSGAVCVGDLLARVRLDMLDAQAYQDLPFEQVVELAKPARSLAHSPLFQASLSWMNEDAVRPAMELDGLRLEEIQTSGAAAKFDVALELSDSAGRIAGTLDYATALFDRATAQRLAVYLQRVLRAMVADDQVRLDRIALLDSAEREHVLHGLNATHRPYPETQTLHGLVEAQVARTPDALAVMAGEVCLSYRELNARANQLAHRLIELGVGVDDRVALCVERGAGMVIGLLGILKSGAGYVPLDPSYPAQRLAWMLEDCAPAVVLVQSDTREAVAAACVPVLDLDDAEIGTQPAHDPCVAVRPDHLAYVIYTSGSTGLPKGVMNEHGGVVNRLCWAQRTYGLTAEDRVLQKTPFGFDVSVWEFFLPLLAGAGLVMARPQGHRDPEYLAGLIEEAGITMLHFVPSMLQLFLDEAELSRCASLRLVLCSGEALSYTLQQRCLARLPQAQLHNLYGPTEAAIDVTAWH